MSQEYCQKPGQPSRPGNAFPAPDNSEKGRFRRPNYMTVGEGSTSQHAEQLQAMLDRDSGYGGSIADDISSKDWSSDMRDDRTAESLSSDLLSHADPERRHVASHVLQLHYNHNRTALGRAITKTLDTLRRLQEYNQQWPAHYPSIQAPPPRPIPAHIQPRPNLNQTQSQRNTHEEGVSHRPSSLRRAGTSLGEDTSLAESSKQAAQKPAAEPRLVTPQLARDFSVLKLDLKMDGMAQTEIIHSLRKDSKALAQLLDGQISKSVRHLSLLRERIEDTSSKVLVTGDLNAGKSTFCNALLRRKILPEDEQPCTSIFCEVLDVRDNGGLEEVHAIPQGSTYSRNDESTYQVFPLEKLESIVVDNEHYGQCKVYVKDIRSVDESLLNNGVLDIALIDAPGLNNDSIKTTAVFARQEEIDVVVFVVSAANHFTLSAREFIYDAAREKAYIFMVVNGFDNIKNKKRCEEQVLKQVAHLSPATFKESSELVHFVSSNAIPVAPIGGPGGGNGGSGAASSSSSGPGDEPNDDDSNDNDDEGKHGEPGAPSDTIDKGKGKAREQRRDFAELEASLRRFVLEKRARSKLAPAKLYLMNVLEDVSSLASVNRDVAQEELDRVIKELQELEPVLDQSRKARSEASDSLEKATEDTAGEVYDYTRDTIQSVVADVSQRDLGVEYPGFWDSYSYANDVVAAMLHEISATVGSCEEHARIKTSESVNAIKSLGILHLGDSYMDLQFQSDRMLRRKKDALARQVDVDIEFWDFFDFASLWDRQEKVAGGGMALTVATVLGSRLVGGAGWIDGALGAARMLGTKNLSRLAVPGLALAVILGISYAVTSIPTSLPRRLSTKVATQLQAIDYTHSNALRISSEVRRALKLPSDNLRIGLQRNLEQLESKREETSKIRSESEVARKYFGNLCRESGEIRGAVVRVDLEPAIAGYATADEV